jgi:VanZ family protein
MLRLPEVFHYHDKALHALFYFGATIILNLIYPKRWIIIVISLATFGILIEFLQEYSNKVLIHMGVKPIHGNFDIQDVKYNTIGLVIGTVCFFTIQFLIQIVNEKKVIK